MFIPTTTLTQGSGGDAELAYAQITTGDTSIIATSSPTAETIITAGAVVLDGSTRIAVEFSSPLGSIVATGASQGLLVEIWGAKDGGAAASLGVVLNVSAVTDVDFGAPLYSRLYLTPAAGSWVYSARAWVISGTGAIHAGAGAAGGTFVPAYLRISEAPQ